MKQRYKGMSHFDKLNTLMLDALDSTQDPFVRTIIRDLYTDLYEELKVNDELRKEINKNLFVKCSLNVNPIIKEWLEDDK